MSVLSFKRSLLAAVFACVFPLAGSIGPASAGPSAGVAGPSSAASIAGSVTSPRAYDRRRWSSGRRGFGGRGGGLRYSSHRGWFTGKSFFGHHRWFGGKKQAGGIGGIGGIGGMGRQGRLAGRAPSSAGYNRRGFAPYHGGVTNTVATGIALSSSIATSPGSFPAIGGLSTQVTGNPALVPLRKLKRIRHVGQHAARQRHRARFGEGKIRRIKRANGGRVRVVTPGTRRYITVY